MRKLITNNVVAVFVVIVVLLLVIPLPTALLDTCIIINISVSMIVLLMTMYVSEALEFSIFPSMLLITTLYRLSLNIASTRLILSEGGNAGQVISTIGTFVLQGNVVVGIIIYLIIVLVQFIVITKGAERVSEVSARFTLDAMPGKQMAIDADLNSGIINEQQARERREKIQKEANFYGAMDGATKIVKGDSIMSIIMTAINFVAGIVIGLVQGGMTFDQVLQQYTIATIGDGLVSQIPALLISTGTGMIVTRSVSEGSLSVDVLREFTAQPRVLGIAGGVIMLMILIPGAPKLQPILMGSILIFCATRLRTPAAEDEAALAAAAAAAGRAPGAPGGGGPAVPGGPEAVEEEVFDENEYFKNVDNIYSLIKVEPIELEFGYSLIPLVDENSGGNLINRIIIFRRQYAQEMGFVVPSIRLRDSSLLNANQYVIKVKGEQVAMGEILIDYYLALQPNDPLEVIDGIDTVEPAYGIPSKWILPENRDLAETYGYTVIDPLSVMLTHLTETVKQHVAELLDRTEVVHLVENAKKVSEDLVNEAVPNIISYTSLQKILRNLLREGIPIKDMITILETIVDSAAATKDIDVITENIRVALKRTITRKFCEAGTLRVVTLDAELEKTILSSMSRGDQGIYLSLDPSVIQGIVTQLSDNIKKFKDLSQTPIVLTSHVIRVYFYRLIEQFFPNVYVLSFNEIDNNVQIQAIGNIELSQEQVS